MQFTRTLAILGALAALTLTGCNDNSAEQAKPQAAAKPAAELKLGNWGPQETPAGTPFNQQSNGKSGIWIEVTGINVESGAQVMFGDRPLEDLAISDHLITGAIPNELIQAAGDRAIVVIENGTNRKLTVGTFKVTAPVAKK